jgi:hypothetical protein
VNTDLIVALIAGAVAVGNALYTAATTRRQGEADKEFATQLEQLKFDLDEATRREDRSLKAKAVFDRYRRPLLASAVQLARRIDNVRSRSFLIFLQADDHRAEVALRSILYRFASYLGWRELLNRELTYLDFEDHAQTRDVLVLLDNVRTKLSSSGLDVIDGRSRLMLWTEEQSAIGGLALTYEPVAGVIGFEDFFDQYDERFAKWLEEFAQDLQRQGAADSARLAEIAASLADLITTLDVERVYGDDPIRAGNWRPH